MLAVVKTPHTELILRGFIAPEVLKTLKRQYGPSLVLKADEDDRNLVDVFQTAEYSDFRKNVRPSDYIRTYRENLGLTQVALGKKIGKSRGYVCDLEKGRRAVSKDVATKLAKLFGIPVGRLIQ